MKSLAPIPMPALQRWRVFCTEFLPLAIFGAGVAAAVLLWNRSASAPTLVAEAETVQVDIKCARPGTLAALRAELLQPVTAGTEVARLAPADPKIVEASLAVIRAELAALSVTLAPAVDQQRVNLEFTRLKLDWMRQRVELAALRVQLTLAEANFTRLSAVHESSVISDQAFDEARATRDSLREQVDAQTTLVTQLDPALRALDPAAAGGELPSAQPALRAALDVQESKLRLAETQLAPIPLLAPIDGVVSLVLHRPGETILAGEPILQITAAHPTRLIGFLRQPLTVEPQPGAEVEIRTRTPSHRTTTAMIVQVGQHMEPIFPTLLAAMRLPATPETGLRLHLSSPAGLDLRPGEHVDVFLKR